MLKKHHYLRPSLFVYPEESLVNGSSTLFSALLTKCLEKAVLAVCRYTPRKNTPPYFVALVPQEEELDDQKIQVTPPGFQLVFLPYADDKRKVPFTEKVMANPEQIDKMKAIVQKLRFKYRSDSFENPVLQQHFRNLEALALDLMEPEQAVDLTLPKVEAMNKRLGSLVDEFKELVYPPDYNPEDKVSKRKQDDGVSGSKKPKMEVSEEELKAHIAKGTLGKLTVPMLKEACRVHGLKGGLKKQELLAALTEHFQKD
ncbi:X-ray repair cross-complementing protein 6 isoform X2 [Marmota marmota marmota]|nr:X-ray repair cross-complementing protein 6 isoform X2 [Marmota marmota marmota]